MAQVPFCSARGVLAKVARNTGGKLPSVYQDDILEWIPEGIDLLSNTRTLLIKSTGNCGCAGALNVQNHQIRLPHDFVGISAIEDEFGSPVVSGGDITDMTSPTDRYNRPYSQRDSRATVFVVNPLVHQTQDGTPTTKPGSTVPVYGEDMKAVHLQGTRAYYRIVGNYIQTSFEKGFVKIHYLARPLDADGYPMIPDVETFRTALYWYVLMMLIGAGYQHQVFSYQQCSDEFERWGGRAINEITYPSLDDVARINKNWVRIVPPQNFYSDFFINS